MGKPEPIQPPQYVRIGNVQKWFDVTDDTVRNWAATGAFQIHRRGGLSLVKFADVAAYIEGIEG